MDPRDKSYSVVTVSAPQDQSDLCVWGLSSFVSTDDLEWAV